jgi:uncharacterized protein YcbK (DUF882 family)
MAQRGYGMSRSVAETLYGKDSDVVQKLIQKERTEALKENSVRLRELSQAIKMQKLEKQQEELTHKPKRDEFLSAKVDQTPKLLKEVVENTEEIAKNTKDFLKSAGTGLFKGLKSLLTFGGLVGFLLTGKTGFLSAMVKGLLKYNPIKMIENIFALGGTVAKGVKGFLKLGIDVGKGTFKIIGNTFKAMGTTVKMIKAFGLFESLHAFIIDPLKGILGKGAKLGVKGLVKEGAKGLGKGAAIALKKIPGIDVGKGAFKVIGSTFKAMGTTVKMIKAFGLKGGLFESLHAFIIDPLKGILGKGAKLGVKGLVKEGAKGLGKGAKIALKKIPGVGAILGLLFGIQRFREGDVVGGLGEIASGVASIFPGVGTVVSLGIDALLLFRDVKMATAKKEKGATVKEVAAKTDAELEAIPVIGPFIGITKALTGVFSNPLEAAKSMAANLDRLIPGSGQWLMSTIGWVESIANNPIVKKGMDVAKGGAKVIGNAFNDIKTMLTPAKDESSNFNAPAAAKQPIAQNKTGIINILKNSLGFKTANKKVDVANLQPDVRKNFISMSKEYADTTGKTAQVNSAYRSIAEQKKLFETLPKGQAAAPGRSLHNFGMAVDVQPDTANEMDRMGLIKKYGFSRPVKGEPWHLQPIGTKIPVVSEKGKIGDAVVVQNSEQSNKKNLPNQIINRTTNNVVVVALNDETINKIVEGQMEAAKKYHYSISNRSPTLTVGGRG